MSYEVLYRKWRPKTFEDIIGQKQIVTILKNQIKYKNIVHAYLFTGTRGTGKTSTARIFARAVNCTNIQDSSPCNECEICKSILTESTVDVIEIDGASNRGIENIRELRENVKYNPSVGKYKIYIIDEVHMLTKEAFNALLKTLEEPPPHVIFILATTEPNKLPPTILSRCQRFDFKPVKIKDIVNHLSNICEYMSINYEEEALSLIALNSEGAVRDAISILEQCISFNNETLKYEDVNNILGAVNYETIFNLAEEIGKQNTSKVLTIINEIFMEGKDASRLIIDLISHFRNILFTKINVEIDELLTLPEERLKQFRQQGELFNANQLTSFIYTLSDIEAKLKLTSQPKVLMEIAAVSLCNKELNDSLEGIIERVKQLEEIIATGQINITKKEEKSLQQNIGKTENEKVYTTNLKQKEKPTNIKKGESKKEKLESEDNLNTIKNKWQQILENIIKDKKAQIEALLKEGEIESLKDKVLTISFKKGFEFHHSRLNKDEVKEYISNIIEKHTGENIKLSFVMEDELNVSNDTKEQKDPVQIFEEVLPGEIFNMIEIIDE